MATLKAQFADLVNRDILRAVRMTPEHRPGKEVEDDKRHRVWIPVPLEVWERVYEKTPPCQGHVVIVCDLRYHGGKKAWEMLEWRAAEPIIETTVDGEENLSAHMQLRMLSEPMLGPWGVGEVVWLDTPVLMDGR